MKLVKLIKESHDHDDDEYVRTIEADVQKWKVEEKEKQDKIAKKHRDELAIQQKQIEDKKRAIAAERDELKQHEIENLRKSIVYVSHYMNYE